MLTATAIFRANDLLTLGCYDAQRELGLRSPSDGSVVGCNDMPFVELVDPPPTTVRVRHYEMGRQAAWILLQRLSDPNQQPFDVVLKSEFVIRASTSAPGRSGRPARAAAAAADRPDAWRRGWIGGATNRI